MNKVFFEKRSIITIKDLLADYDSKSCTLIIEGNKVNLAEAPTSLLRREIDNLTVLNEAGPNDVSYFHNATYKRDLIESKAGWIFIADKYSHLIPHESIGLVVPNPYLDYSKFSTKIYMEKIPSSTPSNIHPSAVIHDSAICEDGVTIGEGVTIKAKAIIKSGSIIKNGTLIRESVIIANNVQIGEYCVIDYGAVINYTIIGNRSYIGSNSVIGKRGFGFAIDNKTGEIFDIPHWGGVIIGNGVSIGANCCVDRGSLRDTIISDNVKMDNLIQIAHNVVIGQNCIMAAQTGVAGSAIVGDNVVMGGQVGVLSHTSVGKNTTLLTRTGIETNIKPGSIIAGFPAVDANRWKKIYAWQNISFDKYMANRGSKRKNKKLNEDK